MNLMRAAQNAYALGDALQTHPGAVAQLSVSREAAPVVVDRQRQLSIMRGDFDRRLRRAGMFENVVERLLDDTVNGDLVAGRQDAAQFADLWREPDRRTGGDLFNHRDERRAQSELIQVRWAQVLGNRTHLFERLRDRVTERAEL